MTESEWKDLTLDRPALYEIIVPGVVAEKWFQDYTLDGHRPMTDQEGGPCTVLTVIVDQAALHGLLRYLYTLQLPLLSVKWIGPLSGNPR